MSRQRPSLGSPPPVDRLTRFPAARLEPSTPLFRVVREGNGPWWFSSSGLGRFDLPPPAGTCYLTLDPVAALLEIIGPAVEGGVISDRFLARRRLREVRAPRPRRLADLPNRGSVGFGVTAEIFTITPYALPQAWAARLHGAGFCGLACSVRHDPSTAADGVALFGRSGERRGWRRGRARPIDASLVDRLRDECNIRVAAVPDADELSYAELPEGG